MNMPAFIRKLKSNTGGNLVSVFGMALAMMVVILSITYIVFELSYDGFHDNSERIYNVVTEIKFESGRISNSIYTSHELKNYIDNYIPQVEATVRTVLIYDNISCDEKILVNLSCLHIDPDFFALFDYNLLSGSVSGIGEPGKIILTENLAKRLFGDQAPEGRSVKYKGNPYTVCGIVEDPPENSNLRFDLLLPIEEYIRDNDPGRNFLAVNTFILGRERFQDSGMIESLLNGYYEDAGSANTKCHLLELRKIHQDRAGTRKNFMMFISISILVLVVSVINFGNIFAAHCEKRSRDIRIRKILGSSGTEILWEILVESVFVVLVATMAGLILSEVTLGTFQHLSGIKVEQYGRGLIWIQFVTVGIVIITGLMAGIIPAMRYSLKGIVQLMDRSGGKGGKTIIFRKILIGFQFAISIALIILLLIFFKQIRYISDYDPGFQTENRLVVKLSRPLYMKYEAFEPDIYKVPGVISMTGKVKGLGDNYGAFIKTDRNPDVKPADATGYSVKDNFFKTYGIKLLQGQTFSDISGRDSSLVIIDRYTAELFGLDDPVGAEIFDDYMWCTIIGVTENADLMPLKGERRPVIFNQIKNYCSEITIHYEGSGQLTANSVTEILKSYDPDYVPEYYSSEEIIEGFYGRDRNIIKMIFSAGIIAILISMFGAYSMASYLAESQVKEICIRKVNGATEGEVLIRSLADMARIVVVSFVIASPVAWYAGSQWLQSFTEKSMITPTPFLISLAGFQILILVTIFYKNLRTARANPATILRKE